VVRFGLCPRLYPALLPAVSPARFLADLAAAPDFD
jgi:hypothetical protein